MSLVTRGLGTRLLITQGLGEGVEAYFTSVVLPVSSHFVTTSARSSVTGVYSLDSEISGWHYDFRSLENPELLQTIYNTPVGGHSFGLHDGTRLDHWQSGSIKGINYLGLNNYRNNDFLTWTPKVGTGRYSIYFEEHTLYSDYSYVTSINPELNVDGLNQLTLRDDAVHQTISVAMFERTSEFLTRCKYDFSFVHTFTGEIDTATDSRLETEDDDGSLIIENIASRKREFIIRDGVVRLNGDYSYAIGSVPGGLTRNVLNRFFEEKGSGSTSGRDLFLNLFPIQQDSVRVMRLTPASVITELVETNNLNFSTPSDDHYMVDYDLGIITVGGYQAPDLMLAEALTADTSEVSCFINDSVFAAYPDQGIVKIGDEYILYLSKTRNSFISCTRGYLSTVSVAHTIGSVISDIKHGSGTQFSDTLYVAYTAVPRVEYEITDSTVRSANQAEWLNIKPTAHASSNDILQLTTTLPNLASILLEVDAPSLGGNLYGPQFFGTDVSRLTATALDSYGNPTQDIHLTIEIRVGSGTLNSSGHSYTNKTNSLGQIYSLYNAPYTDNESTHEVVDITYLNGNTTLQLDRLPSGVSPSDIWIFQVLKHDRIMGTVGLRSTVTDASVAALPYGLTRIVVDSSVGEEFEDGGIYIEATDGVRYFRTINKVYASSDAGYPVTEIFLNETLDPSILIDQVCYLFEKDSHEWNSLFKDGARVIMYEYRSDVQHPLTGNLGAFFPLHPNTVSGATITFNERTLPTPDAEDPANNLGDYMVIAPTVVEFIAYGKDPISGRFITSNTVRVLLNLPAFLQGVDNNGALPIPYGFTFVTEEFNIAAGIGGANFITINPHASGTDQFSIRIEG